MVQSHAYLRGAATSSGTPPVCCAPNTITSCTQDSTTLATASLSIQSLLHDAPYHNEPSFEADDGSGDVQRYNDKILHETLRVAVCEDGNLMSC